MNNDTSKDVQVMLRLFWLIISIMHEKQFLKNFLNIYSQKKKIWKYLHVTQISLVICMILYQ